MKLYRVISRGLNETEEPVPADLKRRQKNGIYTENGISAWRSDTVSSVESIRKVKNGRKAKNDFRYGVLSLESQTLEEMGYHLKLDKEHVNIRCPGCNMANSPEVCKNTNHQCTLDLRHTFEHLLILLKECKTEIRVPKRSKGKSN